MDDFYKPDPLVLGTKGLVYVGDKIIVYRRSADAPNHPLELDLPGGGQDPGESPFQTFKRETKEEFGLDISKEDIVYARRYDSALEPGKFGYFPVAKLPKQAEQHIVFGDEGIEYMLMTAEEYATHAEASDFLRKRTADYLATL